MRTEYSVIFGDVPSTPKGSINICGMINELMILLVYMVVSSLELEL